MSADGFVFICVPLTESSDEDETSGGEGLPDDDSDVSYENLTHQPDPPSVCSKLTK